MAKMWNDYTMRRQDRMLGWCGGGHMTRFRMRAIFRMTDARIDHALFRRTGSKDGGKPQRWHDRRFRSRFEQ